MVRQFDVVIVGGSFAGLACARTAALKGMKVAVLDAKPEPGARVSTTGIVVKEASDDFDLPARHMRKVRGVKLYSPDHRSVDLHAPGYFFHATDTAEVLRWMAAEAERAGAELMYGQKFDHAVAHERGVALPSLGLHTQFLVGADGARSQVAELFGLDRNRKFLAGLELECEPLEGIDPRFLHCFADSQIAPGYIAWIVPGAGVTQVGVAARRPAKPDLRALLERIRTFYDLRALRIGARRSGLIPVGGTLRCLGTDRVLLVGDAAGMVSPVTGGGIHTALHFGRRAAQLVSDYLVDRGVQPARALRREAPKYRLKLLARGFLDLAPPNLLINAMLMTDPVRALAQRIYFHSRAGDAASFETWTRVFEQDEVEQTARPALTTLRVI